MKKEKWNYLLIFCGIFLTLLLFCSLLFLSILSTKEKDGKEIKKSTELQIKEREQKEENNQKQKEEEETSEPSEQTTAILRKQEATEDKLLGQEKDHSKNELKNIRTVLDGFTNQIYNYNSSQRQYYEGVEIYMTPSGYERFIPGDIGEEESALSYEQPNKEQQLTLNQVQYFYNFVSDIEVKVMVKADFTSSLVNQNKSIQYLEATVLKQENGAWLISNCEIVDTIYQ